MIVVIQEFITTTTIMKERRAVIKRRSTFPRTCKSARCSSADLDADKGAPSNLRHVSRKSLREPHMLVSLRLICCAKSFVLYVCVLSTTCALGSRGCVRETKPSFICSAPTRTALVVHLANLFALFFNSFAITAPRWVSILSLQSIPVTLESNSFNALTRVVSASSSSCPWLRSSC